MGICNLMYTWDYIWESCFNIYEVGLALGAKQDKTQKQFYVYCMNRRAFEIKSQP